VEIAENAKKNDILKNMRSCEKYCQWTR